MLCTAGTQHTFNRSRTVIITDSIKKLSVQIIHQNITNCVYCYPFRLGFLLILIRFDLLLGVLNPELLVPPFIFFRLLMEGLNILDPLFLYSAFKFNKSKHHVRSFLRQVRGSHVHAKFEINLKRDVLPQNILFSQRALALDLTRPFFAILIFHQALVSRLISLMPNMSFNHRMLVRIEII